MTTLQVVGPTLPQLARTAIQAWVMDKRWLEAPNVTAPLPAPVFVTLRNPDRSLRGCIGSLIAGEPDVRAETIRSAVLAASRDPRFSPVGSGEAASLHVEVSVLMPFEPITGMSELDPHRFGVLVRDAAGRQGVLLPQVPGVEDAATQVAVACQKAGMPRGHRVQMWRFAVLKYS